MAPKVPRLSFGTMKDEDKSGFARSGGGGRVGEGSVWGEGGMTGGKSLLLPAEGGALTTRALIGGAMTTRGVIGAVTPRPATGRNLRQGLSPHHAKVVQSGTLLVITPPLVPCRMSRARPNAAEAVPRARADPRPITRSATRHTHLSATSRATSPTRSHSTTAVRPSTLPATARCSRRRHR